MKLGPRRTGCDMAKMLQNKVTSSPTEEPSSTDYEISIKDGIVIGLVLVANDAYEPVAGVRFQPHTWQLRYMA